MKYRTKIEYKHSRGSLLSRWVAVYLGSNCITRLRFGHKRGRPRYATVWKRAMNIIKSHYKRTHEEEKGKNNNASNNV